MSTAEAPRENLLLRDAKRGKNFWVNFPTAFHQCKCFFFFKINLLNMDTESTKVSILLFPLTSSGKLGFFSFKFSVTWMTNGLHHKNTGWIKDSWIGWAAYSTVFNPDSIQSALAFTLIAMMKNLCFALLIKLYNGDNIWQNMKDKV